MCERPLLAEDKLGCHCLLEPGGNRLGMEYGSQQAIGQTAHDVEFDSLQCVNLGNTWCKVGDDVETIIVLEAQRMERAY